MPKSICLLCKILITKSATCITATLAFSLLGIAFYLEYVNGLEPCPLCFLQRLIFFCIGIVCLVSATHKSTRYTKHYSYTVTILATLGSCLSIRHLYLQSLPFDQMPACLPGLSYMLQEFPLLDLVKAMIMGTGDCGQIAWSFLGLSIPGWTLVAFMGIFFANILQLIQLKIASRS